MRIIKYSEKNVNNGFMTSKQKILVFLLMSLRGFTKWEIYLNKYIFQ